MTLLTRYLTRLFFVETLALSTLVIGLLYLVQCLRILDVVTVKGQDLVTLLGQAALVIPQIGSIFIYICVGVGLARVLSAMQANGELHIIHSSGRVTGLLGSIAAYAGLFALLVLTLSHLASPVSLRRFDAWSASVAADLVGRALVPHRFAEVVPGVSVVIAAREGEGKITGFFSDDRRDPMARRTYSARSAIVARDDAGYVLQMQDGVVQYMNADNRFTEIAFARYDLAVELLTQQNIQNGNVDSITLISNALESGTWPESTLLNLAERSGEGLRVLGMCMLIAALAAFPTGRRRALIPLELVVLVIAFLDRGLSTYAPDWFGVLRPASGGLTLIFFGTLALLWRFLLSGVRWPRLPALPRLGRAT